MTQLTPYLVPDPNAPPVIVSRPSSVVAFVLPPEHVSREGDGLTDEQRDRLGRGYVTHGEMAAKMEQEAEGRKGRVGRAEAFWLA